MSAESDVREARADLAALSDLHDASLTTFSVHPDDQTVRMAFKAEEYETEAVVRGVVVSRGVRSFRVSAPQVSPGFEDYAFPKTSLIDVIDVEAKDGFVNVLLRGTYGWRVEVVAEGIVITSEAQSTSQAGGDVTTTENG